MGNNQSINAWLADGLGSFYAEQVGEVFEAGDRNRQIFGDDHEDSERWLQPPPADGRPRWAFRRTVDLDHINVDNLLGTTFAKLFPRASATLASRPLPPTFGKGFLICDLPNAVWIDQDNLNRCPQFKTYFLQAMQGQRTTVMRGNDHEASSISTQNRCLFLTLANALADIDAQHNHSGQPLTYHYGTFAGKDICAEQFLEDFHRTVLRAQPDVPVNYKLDLGMLYPGHFIFRWNRERGDPARCGANVKIFAMYANTPWSEIQDPFGSLKMDFTRRADPVIHHGATLDKLVAYPEHIHALKANVGAKELQKICRTVRNFQSRLTAFLRIAQDLTTRWLTTEPGRRRLADFHATRLELTLRTQDPVRIVQRLKTRNSRIRRLVWQLMGCFEVRRLPSWTAWALTLNSVYVHYQNKRAIQHPGRWSLATRQIHMTAWAAMVNTMGLSSRDIVKNLPGERVQFSPTGVAVAPSTRTRRKNANYGARPPTEPQPAAQKQRVRPANRRLLSEIIRHAKIRPATHGRWSARNKRGHIVAGTTGMTRAEVAQMIATKFGSSWRDDVAEVN